MNTNVNLNEFFYGKEASEKIDKFKNGMLEIELKHSNYFDQRSKNFEEDENNRLHKHYIMETNRNGISFNFINDSDLVEHIKNECTELFDEIFNPK